MPRVTVKLLWTARFWIDSSC